jgi:modification methylase
MLTVTQAAKLWGLTPRRIQAMCANGKIQGAARFGKMWVFPKSTAKPIDGRTREAKNKEMTRPMENEIYGGNPLERSFGYGRRQTTQSNCGEIVQAVVTLIPRVTEKKADDTLAAFRNRIVCGDALDILRRIPDGSVDLVVTSPPYNLKNSTGNGMKDGRGGKWKNAELVNGYAGYDDNMPHEQYVAWQRECLEQMMRVIPDDGAIFYNHKWRVQNGLLQNRQDIVSGFPVRQIIIWQRKGGINFNAGYFLPTYEVLYLIAKPKFKLAPKANAYGDVWEFAQEMKSAHPAPFPVALINRIVSSTCAQTILDPFMGSGTTAISALQNKRDYIGIELSPKYCKVAEDRIDKFKKGLFYEG